MLNFFSAVLMLSWRSSVGPSANTKKFLQLSVWDDEIVSPQKITTFPAKSLPKLHEPAPSDVILWLF